MYVGRPLSTCTHAGAGVQPWTAEKTLHTPGCTGEAPLSPARFRERWHAWQHAEPCGCGAVVRDVRLLADLFVDTLSCLQAAGSASQPSLGNQHWGHVSVCWTLHPLHRVQDFHVPSRQHSLHTSIACKAGPSGHLSLVQGSHGLPAPYTPLQRHLTCGAAGRIRTRRSRGSCPAGALRLRARRHASPRPTLPPRGPPRPGE